MTAEFTLLPKNVSSNSHRGRICNLFFPQMASFNLEEKKVPVYFWLFVPFPHICNPEQICFSSLGNSTNSRVLKTSQATQRILQMMKKEPLHCPLKNKTEDGSIMLLLTSV